MKPHAATPIFAVALSIVLLAVAAAPGFAQDDEIDCEELAIRSTLGSVLPARPGECRRTAGRMQGNLIQHYRLFVLPDGFSPVVYLHIFGGSFLMPRPIRSNLESFGTIKTDARNWGERRWISAGDERFEIARFDLPDLEGCLGFQAFLRVRRDGYSDIAFGFFCKRRGTPVSEDELEAFLASLSFAGAS